MSAGHEHPVDVSDLQPGTVRGVRLDGMAVALVNVDGRIHALHDQCTHMKSRLSSGYLEGAVLVCPAHFGGFDVASGAAVARPCRLPVRTFPVRHEGTTAWVRIAEGEQLTPQRCSSP
ncbi:MAG: Rieske (2Fe-2S) protein [Lautropia sp.]